MVDWCLRNTIKYSIRKLAIFLKVNVFNYSMYNTYFDSFLFPRDNQRPSPRGSEIVSPFPRMSSRRDLCCKRGKCCYIFHGNLPTINAYTSHVYREQGRLYSQL